MSHNLHRVECRLAIAVAIASFCANLWLYVDLYLPFIVGPYVVFNDRVIISFYAMWRLPIYFYYEKSCIVFV